MHLEVLQQGQTAPLPTQADTVEARLQALLQVMAALGADLQAFIGGQGVIKPQAAVWRARKKKEPCCKFCGNIGHIIKACREAEQYICIGKCKQNNVGKIVLPSGADIPPAINCKTLQERSDKYHKQQSTLPAGMIRLRPGNLASWRSSRQQELRQVAPVQPSPTPLTPREVLAQPGQQADQQSTVLLTARQVASQVRPQHFPVASMAAAHTPAPGPTISDNQESYQAPQADLEEEFSVLCTILPSNDPDKSSTQRHREA